MTVDPFRRFVETFSVDKYKFGEISINSRVNMRDIAIYSSDWKITPEFVNQMKSIKTARCICWVGEEDNTNTLIDHFIFKFWLHKEDRVDKIAELLKQEWTQRDCIVHHLKLLKRFRFYFGEWDWSKVRIIKRSFPFWELIDCEWYLAEDLEVMTNPILYQNGVQSFRFYHYENNIYISNKFISNIWEIKPKSIRLKCEDFEYKSKSNFIDILSQLPNQMQITFKKDNWAEPISLRFSRTFLKIHQADRNEFLLLEWKWFIFEIDQNYLKNIKVMNHSNSNLEWLVLNLKHYK